jgi:phosphate transport system permease protein
MKNFKKKFIENLSARIFLILAFTSILALAIITGFIFSQGVPLIADVGIGNFLFSADWDPATNSFGIGAMIIGSVLVTLGAALIGIPVGICSAIFMAEFAPEIMRKIFRPAIQLLAGIPSVVYGFWGLLFVVPFIRDNLGWLGMGSDYNPGLSMLAGSVVLSIMMLPTIISIAEVSIMALPRTYKEGALALGMTHWQTIYSVQLPAAKSGIVAGVILGLGRAVGETMAVIMVLGNATALPESILSPIRTLTTNIGIEMGYATGKHQQALFATGIVLFVIIMCLNITAQYITRNKVKIKK